MDRCPVIHKVTDAVAEEGGVETSGKCPVPHEARNTAKLDKDLAVLDKEFDEIGGRVDGEAPSLKQYRKLKRVMASITGFYLNGTTKKRENYEAMVMQLFMIT